MDLWRFYTANSPSDWEEIIRIHAHLRGMGEDRKIDIPGELPHPWEEHQSTGTIWDSRQLVDEWGYMPIAPTLHPLLIAKVVQVLGMEEEDLLDLLWWRTSYQEGELVARNSLDGSPSGAPQILDLLTKRASVLEIEVEDFVMTRLPVPPLSERNSIPIEEGVQRRPGLEIYLNLIQGSQLLLRNSDQVFEDMDTVWIKRTEKITHQRLQDWFEKLWYSCHAQTGLTRWEAESQAIMMRDDRDPELASEIYAPYPPDMITPEMVQETWEEEDYENYLLLQAIPLAILEVTEQQLWLQYIDRGELIDLSTFEVAFSLPTKGELIGLSGGDYLLAFRFLEHVLVYDLNAQKWLEHYGGVDLVYIEELSPENAYLVDIKRQQTLLCEEVIDYPMPSIRTRDGKFIWVEDKEASGGIYDTDSGWPVFNPGGLDNTENILFLDRQGALHALSSGAWEILRETLIEKVSAYQEIDLDAVFQQNALGLKERKWWFFLDNALWVNGDAIWRTDMPVTAAAFNRDVTKLFLANKDELMVIALSPDGKPSGVQSHSFI